MLKHDEVKEKLDWLKKGVSKNVIADWKKNDEEYLFSWYDQKKQLNWFFLYDFMPNNIIRLSINHLMSEKTSKPGKVIKQNNDNNKLNWSCYLTFLSEDLAKVLAWLCLLINTNNKKKYLEKKLPRGFVSVGSENFTSNKYFFSNKALKIIQLK